MVLKPKGLQEIAMEKPSAGQSQKSWHTLSADSTQELLGVLTN
jgi:hypothetical protein